jgi:hypothetical protein
MYVESSAVNTLTTVCLNGAELDLIEAALHKTLCYWQAKADAEANAALIISTVKPYQKLLNDFEIINPRFVRFLSPEALNSLMAIATEDKTTDEKTEGE